MEDNRTLYERNVQDRSTLRYYAGLLIRFRTFLKHERARRVARKNGASIGSNVVLPISLAKKANKNLIIGDNSSIQTDNFSSLRYRIVIGKNVIIGNNAKFVMGSHNIDSLDWEHMRSTEQLVVEDYVWICPDAVILPSCSSIGYGAVVGANAVAVKNIERLSVVSGNPAKEIKKRSCVHKNLVVESMLGGDFLRYREVRKGKFK